MSTSEAKTRTQARAVSGVELSRGIGVQAARGFWQDAWSQVIRRPSAVAGLVWVGVVAFFAVFAPFIASGYPLIERQLGAGGVVEGVSYPLFARLSASDVLLLLGAVAGVCWILVPARLPRSARLGAMFFGAFQAGITVILVSLAAGAAGERDAADWLRAMEKSPWFRETACALIAAAVAVPFAALPLIPRRGLRLVVVTVVAVVSGTVCWSTWSAQPTRFDSREREAAGEISATYTLIPWSPNQRRTDLDLLRPGASYHSPEIRAIVRGRPDLVLDGAAIAGVIERVGDVRVPPAERPALRGAVEAELSSLNTATVAEVRGVLNRHAGPWFRFGTDSLGQDVLSQMLHACRLSISIGLVSTTIAVLIGVTLGAMMGYFGGWTDMFLFRIVEIFMAVPVLFLLIVAAGLLPPQFRSTYVIMAIIGCFTWTGAARFIRAEFMRLRTQDFVQSARAVGLPLRSVLFKHMLPNGVTPVLVDASFAIAVAILFESILSFLGLGPPDQASWGRLLSDATNQVGQFVPHLAIAPGAAIFLTVLSFTLIGEALRDAIDPKLKKARV